MNYHIVIDGTIGDWGYSKQYVRGELAKYKGKPVNVLVSSLGGDVAHALDIRQQFIDHGDVHVYMSGFVASSATIIATGAKETLIYKGALYLVHKVSNYVQAWGMYNADQIQSLIDELVKNKRENDKIDLVIASLYAGKCKKKVDEIIDVLKEGEWLTANEAQDLGFVDTVLDEECEVKTDIARFQKMMSVQGIPLPHLETKKDSFYLAQVGKAIKNLISRANVNNKYMKEDLIRLNAILEVKGFEVKNEKTEISLGDLVKLNTAVDELNKKLNEKEESIKQKDAQIEALKKQPGATTEEVHTNGEDGKEAVTAKDLYNSVKDFI